MSSEAQSRVDAARDLLRQVAQIDPKVGTQIAVAVASWVLGQVPYGVRESAFIALAIADRWARMAHWVGGMNYRGAIEDPVRDVVRPAAGPEIWATTAVLAACAALTVRRDQEDDPRAVVPERLSNSVTAAYTADSLGHTYADYLVQRAGYITDLVHHFQILRIIPPATEMRGMSPGVQIAWDLVNEVPPLPVMSPAEMVACHARSVRVGLDWNHHHQRAVGERLVSDDLAARVQRVLAAGR